MKDGKCPKCNSATVYTKRQGISFASDTYFYVRISSERMSRSVSDVDHYICTTCGYLEIYIEDNAKLEAVAKDWKKVSAS
jgi:hypothetical protein